MMNSRLTRIVALGIMLAGLLCFAVVASAQVPDNRLTVKFGVGSERSQDTQESDDSNDNRTGHATVKDLGVEYRINDRWLTSARVAFGSSEDSDAKRFQQYAATVQDLGGRVGYRVTEQGWIYAGFERLSETVEISESFPIYAPPPSIVTPFSNFYPAVPPSIIGVGQSTTERTISFEGPSVGTGVRGSHRRLVYQASGEFYPILWHLNREESSSVVPGESKPRTGEVTLGGRTWGWRMDGSIGVRIVGGLGAELAARSVAVYGPTQNDTERFTNRLSATVRAVYEF